MSSAVQACPWRKTTLRSSQRLRYPAIASKPTPLGGDPARAPSVATKLSRRRKAPKIENKNDAVSATTASPDAPAASEITRAHSLAGVMSPYPIVSSDAPAKYNAFV